MTSDLDIYRVANFLIDRYGADQAENHAQRRADDLQAEGDEAGRIVWLGIAEAVKVLLEEKPMGSVH